MLKLMDGVDSELKREDIYYINVIPGVHSYSRYERRSWVDTVR